MKKQILKISVPNVLVAGHTARVNFKANGKRRLVRASTRGQAPIIVRENPEGKGYMAFVPKAKGGGGFEATAKDPSVAFAKVAKVYWA